MCIRDSFRGADPATFTYARRPAYVVGERETFFVGGNDTSVQTQAVFTLAAATDSVYMWMEEGLRYDPAQAQRVAKAFSQRVAPRIRQDFGVENDIDGDPHIYVLNVASAGFGIAGLYNDTDTLPNEVIPASNEINSLIMAVPLEQEGYYLSVLAHEFQHLVQSAQDDSEETWIVEGIAELGSLLALPEYFGTSFQEFYLSAFTGNQLNAWPASDDTTPYYGGASLFLTYVTQRFGEGWTLPMAQDPADGTLGVASALQTYGALNPDTGQPITFDEIFADFVVTNWVNNPALGDGRYAYTLVNLQSAPSPSRFVDSFPLMLKGELVKQYGTQYILLQTDAPRTVTVDFAGRATVNVLPTQAHSGRYFWWSQRGNQGNAALTGRFDLRSVPSATLSFWTWYDLEDLWDYGYISLSTDNGATWQVLTTPRMTNENPYQRAFATGYSGRSGGGENLPAPYIGVGLDEVDLRVTELVPNAPAQAAGVQVGDRLAAINGQALTVQTFTAVIDQYQPGDTITLTVERDGTQVDLPLKLAAHPNRLVQSPMSWVQETLDLTPYIGNEVLIRFDYVTDQALSLNGWALDDVSIPEIGFFDDMENGLNSAWTAAGWVQIENLLQQHYLVQVIQTNGQTLNITRPLLPTQGLAASFSLNLTPETQTVLAISGATPVTDIPAVFDLSIR
jgi:hypothetical protein